MKVLVLLFTLFVQGRGCEDSEVTHLLNLINPRGHDEFKEVFPKDYMIRQHYNSSLLCDSDPCCLFRAAAVLADSWSQLLFRLHRVHIKYKLIMQLQKKLQDLTVMNFQESPDLSVFPLVSSTPEDLLSFTSTLFSRLKQQCPLTEKCEFPTLPPSSEEEALLKEITNEGGQTVRTSILTQGEVEAGEREQWRGFEAPPNGLATSAHPPLTARFCVCLLSGLGLYGML